MNFINLRDRKKLLLTWDEVLVEYAISEKELRNAVKFESLHYLYSNTFLFNRKDVEEFLKNKIAK